MSGSLFAAHTSVAVDKTKGELERLLVKHGAAQYGTAHDDANGFAVVYFALGGRQIRLQIPIPKPDAYADPKLGSWQNKRANHATPQTWDRLGEASRAQWVREQWEQACRTRWRCMLLIVKAKLELIGMSLSTIDREFLADITLPDGRSVGEWLKPGIEKAYLGGAMPRMLGMGPSTIDGVIDGEFKEVDE
jgi:hypothetical protein